MESAARPATRASTTEERGIALRTRSRVSFSDAGYHTPNGRNSVNTAIDDSWSPENMEEHIYNASLQSDYAPGVPKNYKELVSLNDPTWHKSLTDELENFLTRDAWEFLPRSVLPPGHETLRCRWIFKQKVDGTKKSRTVVRGYEQEPGVDFVESFSPLATNTTIRVVLAISLEYQQKHNDWVIEMVDVEAAFLNALVDTDVYIEMPDGLSEYLDKSDKSVGDSVIKLKRAQYGLVQSPRLWMETFSMILTGIGLIQCKSDPCLFVLHDVHGELLAMIAVYCDDVMILSSQDTGHRPT